MSDVRALRERIVLATLVAAAGCHKEPVPPPPERVDAAPAPQLSEAGAAALAQLPRGQACATVGVARAFGKGATAANGCPAEIDTARQSDPDFPAQIDPSIGPATLDPAVTERVRASAPDQCCYAFKPASIRKGRPLVADDGEARVAPAVVGRGAADEVSLDLPRGLRTAIGEAWLADALLEHASIASFARATLELMAVGAPDALVEATQRASLDEVRHARATFALAARYLGRDVAPGPLDACAPRAGGLADLALRVLCEGCAGETAAALAATRAAAACEVPLVRDVLATIAEDETRHAELAWSTVAWALRADGARGDVRHALEAYLARASSAAPFTAPARDDAEARVLRAHGRATPDDEARVLADAQRGIVVPALAALLG